MNIAALILALAGAGLSLFQPIVPFTNLSFSDFLSPNSDLAGVAIIVLIVAMIAVICGICIATRTGKDNCVVVLSIYGALYLCSAVMFMGGHTLNQNLPFNIMGMAKSLWLKTVFIWGLCYIAAAACAYTDKGSEHVTSFEPVLGVETLALIKRGKIFLSDGDFTEAERYFEQALRQDPGNSQAYLGKLMAELRVRDIDGLSSVSFQLNEHKLFKRALEFAGNEERSALQKCLEANNEHLQKKKYSEDKKVISFLAVTILALVITFFIFSR